MHTVPIEIKEQLHEFPVGFTAVPKVSLRARHRMLANSWHLRVAAFLLALLLQPNQAAAVTVGRPSVGLHQSAIDTLLEFGNATMARPGPGGWRRTTLPIPVATTMEEHWRLSSGIPHPAVGQGQVEPGLRATMEAMLHYRRLLNHLRLQAVAEVRGMIADQQDVTRQWLDSLHPQVRQVYVANGTKPVTQVPVLFELMRRCQYPGLEDMARKLESGFPLIGKQSPGVGWNPRTDGRYAYPIGLETFKELNTHHLRERLKTNRPSQHWEKMLAELLEEKRKGRLDGPFRAPSSWKVQTVPVDGPPLVDLDGDEAFAAVCFAVTQSDKVRRCEDYRRSYHNSLIETTDTPHHHSLEAYVDLIKAYKQCGVESPCIWIQDLDAAYRQIPVLPDRMAYTVLVTPDGPTLWRHAAAHFGATASVWAFNRFADMLMVIARRLLLIPVGHFVDDFASVDPDDLAQSSCHSFRELFGSLGLAMKSSKEQPPRVKQKLLGVYVHVRPDTVELEACPRRLQKTWAVSEQCQEHNCMSPTLAQQCAGKLAFLATTFFGQAGRAALQPLYMHVGMDWAPRHMITCRPDFARPSWF